MNERILVAIAIAAGAGASASANLIVNPSFELPNYGGGWSASPNDGVPGGWYDTSGYGLEIGAGGIYGVTGYTGNQVMEIDSYGNSTIHQDVPTGSGLYTLSLDVAQRLGVSPDSAQVSVYWNGNLLQNIVPPNQAMQTYSYSVLGNGGVNSLILQGTGISDSYGAIIDNVQLNAVPEPVSCLTLAVGVAGLLRRRNKA